MKFKTAIKLMTVHNNALMEAFPDFGPKKKLSKPKRSSKNGFAICFENIEKSMLRTNYFPEDNERLISTLDQAWEYAQIFAAATKGYTCNLYVVDSTWYPTDKSGKRYSDHIKNR